MLDTDPTWLAYANVFISSVMTLRTFLAADSWFLNAAWGEVIPAAGNRANTPTMFTQSECHWYVVLTTHPGRAFHLDVWRPDRGCSAIFAIGAIRSGKGIL
jgi:hypothetical protein